MFEINKTIKLKVPYKYCENCDNQELTRCLVDIVPIFLGNTEDGIVYKCKNSDICKLAGNIAIHELNENKKGEN